MTTRVLTPAPRGFHGDRYLLRLVQRLLSDAEVFVETGSNVGSSLGEVALRHPHVEAFSCEPDPDACAAARDYAVCREGVHLFQETSQEFMKRLDAEHSDRFSRRLVAWLDAHDYGFEWPLQEEIRFLTRRFTEGAILIDDFKVPGAPEFGFDGYNDHSCEWAYVEDEISPDVAYRLSYPSYREHTSAWHPLRGWGLLQFGPDLASLPRLEEDMADVLIVERERKPLPRTNVSQAQAPSLGRELPRAIAMGESGRMVTRDPYQDCANILGHMASTVVDGGSNRGDTVQRLRQAFPDATIHAFEPISELAASIRRRFESDARLVVHAAALSSEGGTLPFHVTAAHEMSSTRIPSDIKRRYQAERADIVNETEVVATTLDDALRGPVDLLKLDLQGHELEALEGYAQHLAGVRVILTEVEFVPLYDGQPLFADIDAHLRAAGFRLFNLYELWSHPEGQLTSGDAVYVNERYYS